MQTDSHATAAYTCCNSNQILTFNKKGSGMYSANIHEKGIKALVLFTHAHTLHVTLSSTPHYHTSVASYPRRSIFAHVKMGLCPNTGSIPLRAAFASAASSGLPNWMIPFRWCHGAFLS